MAENMMNSEHITSNPKSRSNHSRIFGTDPRDPTEEHFRYWIPVPPVREEDMDLDELEQCGTCERGKCDGCDNGLHFQSESI